MDDFGAGQGSVCSPIIANIYMHYVLIWWFNEKIKPLMKGFCDVVAYADDFVCCFQYKKEAELFYELLKKRMGHFGLTLEESKTRLIYFGRFAEDNLARDNDIVNITLHFFLKDVRPMLPLVMKHNTVVA